jgi:uncharacterized DUF497 family protein
MPKLFDGSTVEAVDDRFNYGETRTNCLGEIGGRIFIVTITWRGADRRIRFACTAARRVGRGSWTGSNRKWDLSRASSPT